ncbi:MAG: protein TolR [Desulfobacterales bacterium C00003060]|nr:MAG: protein TolR [Desulfobacterales bacterium S3730MH5]OEU78912.1 MAG: protein TolR [Desulfobacterales bacterium S5133MH4]OEU81472.1 MAG: protein TolR [Desulfobacterales bacterium C00003060]
MQGSNSPFMSDINVTPLVDVMLVLLIIFMVTAPMMMQGVHVSLPQTTSKPLPAEQEHLIITVDGSRQIYINDYKVALDALEAKLKKIYEGHPDQKVYLRADKNVPYGIVVRVMSEVKGAGVKKLGMVTEPQEKIKKKQ